MVRAPALIAVSTARHKKSSSVRLPSSADHSTSSVNLVAKLTLSLIASITVSSSICNLCFICSGDVEINVCMRRPSAGAMASAQTSISLRMARDRPHTVAFLTVFATCCTLSKSPLEAMGKPASIISTPMSSSRAAILSFSSRFMEQPGDCSPSRNVVSNIYTRSVLSVLIVKLLNYNFIYNIKCDEDAAKSQSNLAFQIDGYTKAFCCVTAIFFIVIFNAFASLIHNLP